MRRVAALLRAVNVGGVKLLMSDFRRVLAGLGYEDPETLVASGNAVFGTDRPAAAVEAAVKSALARELGLATEVFVRDHAELAAVIAANPFPDFARESPSKLMAVFLADEPPQDLSPLERWATAGEMIARGPRCLYIGYPEGAGRSKLANARGTPATAGTARNWNTVGKLHALTVG
ncbi:DUF1697 domain-containing protein [Phenylobacterium sp.]|jgi:uncharacterized protein (DUF1697 family)|uniref:DUF1697 domain-containing protein n=1 Tax=Phenylobacterium sp. TaxID=1871053 RepID=UPI002F91CA12